MVDRPIRKDTIARMKMMRTLVSSTSMVAAGGLPTEKRLGVMCNSVIVTTFYCSLSVSVIRC